MRSELQFFQDFISESGETRQKIKKHNSRVQEKRSIRNPLKFVNASAHVIIPDMNIVIAQFPYSSMYIPKPPQQTKAKLSFPFYKKNFLSVYFMIGQNKKGIWGQFQDTYHQIIPKQQRPLQNLVSYQQIQKVKRNLQGFIDSGLQVKVLIQIQKSKLENFHQEINKMLSQKQIIKVYIEDSENTLSHVMQKYKIVASMQKQFEKQIKRSIKGFSNLKDVIYFNFVNLEVKSVEVFQRKNLIQECIRPKGSAQILSTFEKFTQMLQNYQNVSLVSEIDRLLYDKKSGNVSRLIQNYKEQIKQIQKQQKQFCSYFKKQLQNGGPIEERNNRGDIYFKIVDEYKQEHSVYEIINNGIRRSFSINQINVQCMSTFIKYLYEAICYFFQTWKKQFEFKKVYRGARISDLELQTLRQGSILMNLGFTSTSIRQEQARGFIDSKSKNGYLLIINLGQDYKKSDYKLEGFFQLNKEYNKRGKSLLKKNYNGQTIDTNQEEVLFNPLNVFKISKIDKGKKIIELEYAPHLTLALKTQNNTITAEQKKQFNDIKSHLSSLVRSNYDKGKDLHQKGETTKALQHYEQAQKNGELLTTTQKFNIIQILKDKKEFDKIDIELKKIIKQCESQVQKNKANKIKNLNKQSQYLQISCQYFASEKVAVQAHQQSMNLQREVEKSNKRSDKQVIQSFYSIADSNLKLSQSRYQKNENEKSIQNAFMGFKYVDELYLIYEKNILPKIKIILQNTNIQNISQNPHLFPNLMKIRNIEFRQISQKERQQNLKKSFKQISQKERQQNLQKSFKQQSQPNKNKFDQKIKKLDRYFKSRGKNYAGRAERFEIFEQAAYEIQNQLDSGPSIKLVKSSFLELRQGIQKIRSCQKQLYDVIKSNLKVANKDLKPCLQNEKQCYYSSARFEKYEEYIKKEMNEEINLERIREYNKYSSFLLDYIGVCEEENQKKKFKYISSKIIDTLLEKIEIVEKEFQSEGIKLTQTKTQLTQTQITEWKNNSLNSNIIEKAAAQYSTVSKNDKNQGTNDKNQGTNDKNLSTNDKKLFRSLSGSKNREDFNRVKQKLSWLEQKHESDAQINQFYFILRDLNTQIDLLNNSYSVAESSSEYLQFLSEANQKIQQFNTDYIKKVDLKLNEQLALFYILEAQNKLKRGYFKQAQKIIIKTKNELMKMYNSQNVGQNISFNTLVARQVPVKLFKIESELVGIYGSKPEKNKVMKYLLEIKNFVETHASLNILAQAQINQSVAFVATRILPEKITQKWSQTFKQALLSLNKTIQYRKGLLGDQNEYLAIAYTFLIFIKSKKIGLTQQETNKVQEDHNHALTIFLKLGSKIILQNGTQSQFSHMEKQPILFLYKMLMENSYQKITNQNQSRETMLRVFRQNVNAFQKNEKGLKSLQIVESIFEAGQVLSEYPQHKEEGEKYLKKCQDDIEVINTVNRDYTQNNEKMGSNELIQIKYKLCKTFLKMYDSWSWSDRKKREKYEQAVKIIEKIIKKKQNPLELDFFQYTFDWIQKCFG